MFARLRRRLDQAGAEAALLARSETLFVEMPRNAAADWARCACTAFGIVSVYGGLERILEIVADEIDGERPAGHAADAELLAAMASDVADLRPALLSAETHALFDDLRRFRRFAQAHFVSELTEADIAANRARVRAVLPAFARDLTAFEQALGPPEQDLP
jgi:hypothetical protein